MTRIVHSLAVIIISLLQVSFLVTWPRPVSTINLLLVLIIFLVALGRYQHALLWSFGGGLLLDLYSFGVFGGQTAGLLVTTVLIHFLFNNFFTNYSFYSLTVLGIIGTILNAMVQFFSQLLGNFFELTTNVFGISAAVLLSIGWQVFFHLILLYVLFFIFHFLIGRLRVSFSGLDSISMYRPPTA